MCLLHAVQWQPEVLAKQMKIKMQDSTIVRPARFICCSDGQHGYTWLGSVN